MLIHKGKGPWWVNVMIAAERWGVGPWVIGGGGPLRWFLRWQEMERIKMEANRDE